MAYGEVSLNFEEIDGMYDNDAEDPKKVQSSQWKDTTPTDTYESMH